MAKDDIVQNIVLAGEAEVIAGLAAIGVAGKAAFTAIRDAARGSSISEFTAAISGASLAISGLVGGLFAWTEATAGTITQMTFLAKVMGTNIETFGSFSLVLNSFLGDTDNLTSAMKRLSVRVEQDWPIIQKSIRGAADLIVQDQLRIQSANLALERSVINLQFAEQDASQLRIANSISVESAELRLREARAQRAAGPGGRVDATDQARFENIQQRINVEQAELALQQAQEKQLKDQLEAENKLKQATEEKQVRQLALSEGLKKQTEDQANNIQGLKKYVEDTVAGISTVGTKVQLSSENIVRGIIAATKEGTNTLSGFKGTLGEIGTAAPAEFDVLKKLADYFHNTTDETQKAAVAISFFGRGVQPAFIQALSQGSAALEKEAKRLEDLGFGFTSIKQKGQESDEFISYTFARTLATLSTEVGRAAQQFSLLFAPGFTQILGQIQQYVETNRASFVQWGASIRDTVIPALQSVARVLLGIPDQAKDQWLIDYTSKIKAFGTAVQDVFVGLVIPAFKLLVASADYVAQKIKDLTGSFGGLTGTDLLVGAWVLRMVGAFALLRVTLAAAAGTAGAAIGTSFVRGILLGLTLIPLADEIAKYLNIAIDKVEEWVESKFSSAKRPDVKTLNENRDRARRGLPPLPTEESSTLSTKHETEQEWTDRIRKEDAAAKQADETALANQKLGESLKTSKQTLDEWTKFFEEGRDKGAPPPPPPSIPPVTGGSPTTPTVIAPSTIEVKKVGEPLSDQFKSVPKELPEQFKAVPQAAKVIQQTAEEIAEAIKREDEVIKSYEKLHPSEHFEQGGPIPGRGPKPIVGHGGEFVVKSDGSNLFQAIQHYAGGGPINPFAETQDELSKVTSTGSFLDPLPGTAGMGAPKNRPVLKDITPKDWMADTSSPYFDPFATTEQKLFEITHEGNKGFVMAHQEGNLLHVDDIAFGAVDKSGMAGGQPGALGLSATRSVFRDLLRAFPGTSKFGGMRISGAREKAGTVRTKGNTSVNAAGSLTPGPEKIVAAAYKTPDGKVFTGVIHPDAYDAAEAAGYPNPLIVGVKGYVEDSKALGGFITSTGRYVTREQAISIANKAKQLQEVPEAWLGTEHFELGINDEPKYQQGGKIPGSGRGDKVPIMAEPGEFMVRRDGSNLGDALRYFGKSTAGMLKGFNMGGLIDSMSMPSPVRYQEGGEIARGSRSNERDMKHLGVIDLRTDYGPVRVYGDSNSLDNLRRASIQKQTVRTGAQPSWYGGTGS